MGVLIAIKFGGARAPNFGERDQPKIDSAKNTEPSLFSELESSGVEHHAEPPNGSYLRLVGWDGTFAPSADLSNALSS
jgi:hypothetical protein